MSINHDEMIVLYERETMERELEDAARYADEDYQRSLQYGIYDQARGGQ